MRTIPIDNPKTTTIHIAGDIAFFGGIPPTPSSFELLLVSIAKEKGADCVSGLVCVLASLFGVPVLI